MSSVNETRSFCLSVGSSSGSSERKEKSGFGWGGYACDTCSTCYSFLRGSPLSARKRERRAAVLVCNFNNHILRPLESRGEYYATTNARPPAYCTYRARVAHCQTLAAPTAKDVTICFVYFRRDPARALLPNNNLTNLNRQSFVYQLGERIQRESPEKSPRLRLTQMSNARLAMHYQQLVHLLRVRELEITPVGESFFLLFGSHPNQMVERQTGNNLYLFRSSRELLVVVPTSSNFSNNFMMVATSLWSSSYSL
ncbi:unnamed protein product [Trichogramma brassicae]|uniref:Uncharacterized protein n=1 Tax=Trichogramma brassicae TaxID=86971 RepID=A0A6H5I6F1_9HYME|nr:unnamed protein product [Trichogramma brassicae]